ncbi:hypothetical protein P692DRAFT_20816148 [Suillus brevipes Sb2]|nr:hypothetical protein P692DRAFT_20816148 [Suillus brevipes Sb2]
MSLAALLHALENFPTDFTDSLDMRQCSTSKYCTLVTRSPGYGGSSGHAGKPEKLTKIRLLDFTQTAQIPDFLSTGRLQGSLIYFGLLPPIVAVFLEDIVNMSIQEITCPYGRQHINGLQAPPLFRGSISGHTFACAATVEGGGTSFNIF